MNNLNFFAAHSVDKVVPENGLPSNQLAEYTLYLAKGETKGVQLVVASDNELNGLIVRCRNNEENIKCSIFEQRYIEINGKHYPDPVVPYENSEFSLNGVLPALFLAEFSTSSFDGRAEYVFDLVHNDEIVKTVIVNVSVWNFELPPISIFSTSIGLLRSDLERYYGYQNDELYFAYHNALLDHNITPYYLPYDVLDDRADQYMSDPRITSFQLDAHESDERLTAIYNKLCTNEEWLKKAYFLPLDEPREPQHIPESKEHAKRLRRLCPKIRITAPFYINLQIDERDQIDHMAEYTDLWCPKLCLWDDNMSYNEDQLKKKPESFASRMEGMKKRGDTVWCYICNAPNHPYANIWVDGSGVEHRILFWQQYQKGASGFLYWATTCWFWPKRVDPWKDVDTDMFDDAGVRVYGEGLLLYPGVDVGILGPAVSMRIKMMRDGIDDYRLFSYASDLLGERYVLEMIDKVTPSLTQYTSDPDLVCSVRNEIGTAIENKLNEGK